MESFAAMRINDPKLKLDRRIQSILTRGKLNLFKRILLIFFFSFPYVCNTKHRIRFTEKIDTVTKVLSTSKVALRLIGLADNEITSLKKQIADLSDKTFVTG